MGKGFQTVLKYPKLTCSCVIYIMSCFILFIHTPNKQHILQRNSLISPYARYDLDESAAAELSKISKMTSVKYLKHHSGKHSLKQFLTINVIDKEKNDSEHEKQDGPKCDMTKYLSFNKQVCDEALNKDNRFLLPLKSREKPLLNRFHNKASKNLPEYFPYYKDKFNCNIYRISQNCVSLRMSYKYGKKKVSNEETLFPLAFAMKIHESANQAHRLLRYIYREHNIYCIHVDKKASVEIHKAFKEIESCFENILVIDEPINVVYSTIRQVEAEMTCMNAVNKAKLNWKYYINLTGQEFMLKTNLEIVKILKILNGTNDIESYPFPPSQYHKFKQRTVIMNNFPLVTKQKKKPFQHNIKIHKGSAYGLFSREFVNFVLNDNFVKEFISWLSDAYAPEELIWATLQTLPGTPGGRQKVALGRDQIYISRAVKWEMDKSVTCHGKYVRWICIYGLEDIPWLLSHRNLVANKFYEFYEPLALDCVEKKMYERLRNGGVANGFNLDTYREILDLKH